MRSLARSFAGGIVGPELYGRIDLSKYQTGVAQARNWMILPHGPLQNRAGFSYVQEVKDSSKTTRLIPFSYNTEQTFAIEAGDGYMRWHTQGATLLEASVAITDISQANPGVATYTGADPADGDWLYLTGLVGMTQLNGRYVKIAAVDTVAKTFQLTDIHGGANINTSGFTTFVSGGVVGRVYEIASPYDEADLFNLHFVQSADVLTIVHPKYPVHELRRLGAANWTLTPVSFVPGIATPAAPTVAASGSGGTPINIQYRVSAVAVDTLEESLGSPASTAVSIDLNIAANFVTITPAVVAGAVRYNVYKLSNGLYGYIGQTDGADFRDNNITANVAQTPPELNNPINAVGSYPGAVGYYEQRRCFGGTDTKPQNFWATRSATESNLSYSIPLRDDDAIAFRIASREVNRIRHILDLGQLVLLTSGGEWLVAPQNSDVLTPSSAAPKTIANEGASNVQPVVAAGAIIYVQESGDRVRELKPNQYDSRSFTPPVDVSVLAPHLFDGFSLTDMAYSKAPYKIVWAVRSDGTLLGLTYLPEQEVSAWHTHDTKGTFEAVACIKEGSEHVLYAIVERFINGRTVKYVEQQHTRRILNHADAFFVDAGLTYDGPPTTTLKGFWHLEGEEVSVLADAAEVTGRVVVNGTIELDQAASKVHAGLQIVADVQTMPMSFDMQAFGQGMTKNISEVYLRLEDTSGIQIGPSFATEDLVDMTMRSDEPYGSPPGLVAGMEQVTVMPEWGEDAQLCIRQSAPLPATILAIVLDTAVGNSR